MRYVNISGTDLNPSMEKFGREIIHSTQNIQAGIPMENIIALFEAVSEVRGIKVPGL